MYSSVVVIPSSVLRHSRMMSPASLHWWRFAVRSQVQLVKAKPCAAAAAFRMRLLRVGLSRFREWREHERRKTDPYGVGDRDRSWIDYSEKLEPSDATLASHHEDFANALSTSHFLATTLTHATHYGTAIPGNDTLPKETLTHERNSVWASCLVDELVSQEGSLAHPMQAAPAVRKRLVLTLHGRGQYANTTLKEHLKVDRINLVVTGTGVSAIKAQCGSATAALPPRRDGERKVKARGMPYSWRSSSLA